MKPAHALFLLLLILGLNSCSGGSGSSGSSDDPNAECGQYWKNGYVYELLQDTYLYADQVRTDIDHRSFASPDALLASVKPSVDRWSYISTADEFYRYTEEGQYPGMGFSAAFDRSRNLWVSFVYEGSPADRAGMKRSDWIIDINRRRVSRMRNLDEVWDEIYHNETALIEYQTQDGDIRAVTLEWDWVTINTVLYQDIIEVGDKTVGYLVFKSFIEPAEAELDAAFVEFNRQGIDDLVLDLRYNGGGRGSIALQLASLIGGERTRGEVFRKVLHNSKYSQYDEEIHFTAWDNALGLDRVFVITTDATCSASEIIINGLAPHMEVIQVGDTTCGKPVGMYAHDFCDQVILPVEFRTANASDETDYYDGLAPTCHAFDDLTREFGDREEDSLQVALYYIANAACPDVPAWQRSLQAEMPRDINSLRGFWREIGAF